MENSQIKPLTSKERNFRLTRMSEEERKIVLALYAKRIGVSPRLLYESFEKNQDIEIAIQEVEEYLKNVQEVSDKIQETETANENIKREYIEFLESGLDNRVGAPMSAGTIETLEKILETKIREDKERTDDGEER